MGEPYPLPVPLLHIKLRISCVTSSSEVNLWTWSPGFGLVPLYRLACLHLGVWRSQEGGGAVCVSVSVCVCLCARWLSSLSCAAGCSTRSGGQSRTACPCRAWALRRACTGSTVSRRRSHRRTCVRTEQFSNHALQQSSPLHNFFEKYNCTLYTTLVGLGLAWY